MSDNNEQFRGAIRPKAFRENLTARTLANKLVADPNKGKYTRRYPDNSEAPIVGTLDAMSRNIADRILDAENILETSPDTELAMRILVSSIISPSDLRVPELSFKCEDAELDPGLLAELIEIVKTHFTSDYKIKDWMEKALEDALFRTGSHVLAVVPENNLDDLINGRSPAAMESFAASLKQQLDVNRVPRGIGNLGNPNFTQVNPTTAMESLTTASLESLFGSESVKPQAYNYNSKVHNGLYVTDNPSALTLGLVADYTVGAKVRRNVATSSKIKVAYENIKTVGELVNRIHQRPTNRMSEIVRIQGREKGSRAPIGHPLVMKLPSESVIPVHIPSDPEKHLGYFVMLDDLGHPISSAAESSNYNDLRQRIKNNTKVMPEQSQILSSLSFLRSGFQCGGEPGMAALAQSYADAVERDLIERLKNGAYGENVEIAKTNEVYRIMLSRVLAGKRTMMLYIPSSLVTYIAFHYTKMGVGRSLLDKNKMLASLRATMLFSSVMASLKNSVARQKVSITLDEADIDPEKTVDLVLTDIAKLRSRATPFGTTSPTDIIDGIQAASMSVEVSGNPRYPEIQVGIEDIQSAKVSPDTDLAERLDKQWWMSMGLAPEIVDSLQQIEFAAVQMTQNALMTKRMAMDQTTFCGFLTDHVRKYTDNSGTLLSQMILAIRKFRSEKDQSELEDDELMTGTVEAEPEAEPTEDPDAPAEGAETPAVAFNESGMAVVEAEVPVEEPEESPYKDLASISDMEIIQEFLENMSVELPPPDTTRIQAQAEEFSNYSDFLDQAIPAYISQDIIAKIGGPEATEHSGELVALVKAYYQREFLIRNNILPELQDLMKTAEETNGGVVENYLSFQDSIGTVLSKLIDSLHKNNNPDDQGGDTGDAGGYNDAPEGDEGDAGDGGDGGDMPADFDLDAEMPEEEPTDTEGNDAEPTEEQEEAPDTEEPDAAPVDDGVDAKDESETP